MTKKIAVYNYKGGIGKSTISSNLAAGLANVGFNVSLWNTDGQNNSLKFLTVHSLQGKPTLYDVIKDDGVSISEAEFPLVENLVGIPSSKIDSINTILATKARIDYALEDILPENETKKYDYMIFDMGAGESKINTAVFYYVDAILMPVQTEYACVDAIPLTYEYLASLRLPKSLIKFVIPNMLMKTSANDIAYQDLLTTFDSDVLLEPIPRRTSISEAGALGLSIFDYKAKEAEPFLNIVERVVKEIGTK